MARQRVDWVHSCTRPYYLYVVVAVAWRRTIALPSSGTLHLYPNYRYYRLHTNHDHPISQLLLLLQIKPLSVFNIGIRTLEPHESATSIPQRPMPTTCFSSILELRSLTNTPLSGTYMRLATMKQRGVDYFTLIAHWNMIIL